MHLSSSDIPPTAIRDIPVQYLLLHTHIVLRLWNIFQYMLFIKKATSIRTFYHKDLIPWKSIIIKKTFQIENATLYKNAHGFEPIKQFCVFLLSCTDLICHRRILRVGKILSKTYTKINSNTKIVGNLYTTFQNHFFSFFHVWCNGVQSLDRSVEKNPEAHRSKEFQNR